MKKRACSAVRMVALVAAMIGLIVTVAMAKDKGRYITPTITAEQAVSTVQAALARLTVGSSIVKTDKRGEKKLEVMLQLDGNTVSKIHLNPATGEILPKGQKVLAYTVSASLEQAVKIVQQALPNLEAASVSLGKKGEWKVDITLKKIIVVATIKVDGGNGSILPD